METEPINPFDDYENIYSSPEKAGLTIVRELGEHGYEFDVFVVWQSTDTGNLYYGSASGCSCTSPFEGTTSVDELDPLTKETYRQFTQALTNWIPYGYDSGTEKVRLEAKVLELLGEAGQGATLLHLTGIDEGDNADN